MSHIARYAKPLELGRLFDAWELLLDDIEASVHDDGSANDAAVDQLLDAFVAAGKLAAQSALMPTIDPSLYWRLIDESADADAGDERERTPVKRSPAKKRAPVQRQKPYLRVVGDY